MLYRYRTRENLIVKKYDALIPSYKQEKIPFPLSTHVRTACVCKTVQYAHMLSQHKRISWRKLAKINYIAKT